VSNLIVLDLDGVITSEEAYWDTAGLVLHELLYSPRYWNIAHRVAPYQPPSSAEESHRLASQVFPSEALIYLKSRSINSNWDTCYCAVVLHLIELLAALPLPERAALFPLQPEREEWIATFRHRLASLNGEEIIRSDIYRPFKAPIFAGYTGPGFIERLNAYATEMLGYPVEGVFGRYSPSWYFCQDRFQEWYLGDELYARTYGRASAQPGKAGCYRFERPLLPKEQIEATLARLHAEGYTLGVATGRPGQEGILPLQHYNWLPYFDERRITTHAQIACAEAELRAKGDSTSLVKPHPYQFMLAANPDYQLALGNAPKAGSFIVVGDTPSDVVGARAAGALTVAVLTGARTPEALRMLEESKPDFIIEDVTKLPALLAQIDNLATIQRMQFSERDKAQRLLQWWFVRHMQLQTDSVTLVPKAVSLNSFNGFYRIAGEEYFFKTHVEEQGVLEEYYHAERLHQAGYHIVLPVRTIHEQGQQMVIYPVVHWPVMFDLVREVETGNTQRATAEMLVAAERRAGERLLDIYQATLAYSTAEEHAPAPIHQLFWHRLTGGRLKTFYAGKSLALPQHSLSFEQLLRYRWQINGVRYPLTLEQLLERAATVLQPAQAAMTVLGHGDAHFGNIFLEEQQTYLYFDPAFAGRHAPLLDIVKPLFHNVFATWMYFPHDIARDLSIEVQVQDETLVVEHTYVLTPVRHAILQTKLEYLVTPLLELLQARGALPHNWLEILQSALLCCPLLTINLFESTRMPVPVSWLGLMFTVMMGHSDLAFLQKGVGA
jgi:phosphoglycolate phosphatase-like HAD superfamily hydrolase